MVDWKKIRCTKCDKFRLCRKKSISKGSKMCLVNRGYEVAEPIKKSVNITHQLLHHLWKGGKKNG